MKDVASHIERDEHDLGWFVLVADVDYEPQQLLEKAVVHDVLLLSLLHLHQRTVAVLLAQEVLELVCQDLDDSLLVNQHLANFVIARDVCQDPHAFSLDKLIDSGIFQKVKELFQQSGVV